MNAITYGLDISKRVFQLYWVDESTGQIFNRRFDRSTLIDFLSNRPSGLVALEACGSGHWWARKIELLGHRATLLHPKFIRPFVQTNKTDASDARAIWTAVNQPGMRTVAVKSEDQQAVLGLHRIRSQLVKVRTMQVNQLRGLLYEFGISLKGGRQAGLAEIRQRMSELDESIPGLLMGALQDSLQRLSLLDDDIRKIERRIAAWMKEQAACRAIAEIPGVGTLAATALVATIGEAHSFKSGREFASFVGLVPRQTGTGGKVRLGKISKRGDCYLRTLLIHGARSVLFTAREKSAWVESAVKRRPANVVATALANKIARTAWAILAHQNPYDRQHQSRRPALNG